jgi:AraC-like DNA-binding protein
MSASLLLGSLHGVALAIVLLRRDRNRSANRYLAALLIAISVLLFDGFVRARGVLGAHPHLIGLAAWVPFALGPLVFLYVREMTSPEPARVPPAWRHFVVPAAYTASLLITFYPRSAAYKIAVANNGGPWIVRAVPIALLVYGIAYAIAALVLLRRHRHQVQDIYSNLRGVSLRWLFALALLNAMVWVGALASFVLRMTGLAEASASSAIVPIGSTITVFVIGYFQLGQAEIYVAPPKQLPPEPATPAITELTPPTDPKAAPEPDLAAPPIAELKRERTQPDLAAPSIAELKRDRTRPQPAYQRARLADEDAIALEARIRAAMTQQKLYQRPGLTVSELADEAAATPHEVSQVLSTRLQRNFYTFVNEHRIEHVKAALETTDRPVLDLAFEAGFQSKSTFNSAFRKATGMTPREFRDRARA